jgi:hypothetical protein
MMLEILLICVGVAIGVLAAIIPYQRNVSNEERIYWGARKP